MTRATFVCARSEHQTARLRMGVVAGATVLSMFAGALNCQVFGAEPTPQADVAGLLASGELGAAADVVAAQPADGRDALVQQVINAQKKAGNPEAAKSLLPLLGESRDRKEAVAGIAREQVLNGGTDASLMMLAMLIQAVVQGNWEETDPDLAPSIFPYRSGIMVDANGVLASSLKEDRTGRVEAVHTEGRRAQLNEDIAASSNLRLVSLTRLEKEIALRMAQGKSAAESMKNLAGLTRIQYVLVYPESNEIVIGGPAEGWRYGRDGQPVALESNSPTLQLDDLVTVMRTFDRGGDANFSCSIDPRKENLKAVQNFVAESQSRGSLSPNAVRGWANKVGQILGNQDISVDGIPADSRVARVMVEADYRMKLIGIGKLNAGQEIPSYFQLLAKDPTVASGNLDALRWWMALQCESVVHSADFTAFEIRGSGVKCLSENEFLTANGERVPSGKAESINRQFAKNFTENYNKLAKQDQVFAELQGIFDLALVAAMIQNHNLDQQANWDRGVFAANGEYRPASFATPKETQSVVNHRVYNGKDIVLQVAGGVRADALAVLNNETVATESAEVKVTANKAKATNLPENRWWWDAK